ncbi:YihY/virulence factor BrkB family protein [bacterium]|nr:YihY/virulence factor BrkB family protein [bacterium]
MLKKAKSTFAEYFYKLIETMVNEDFANAAAEMAFMLAIGIFPFMLFVTAIFGWLGKKFFMAKFLGILSTVAPNDVIHLIQKVLNEVIIFEQDGVLALVGLVLVIFLAHNAVAVVIKGLNRASMTIENRPFIVVRLLSIFMVFVYAFLLFISINLIVFGKVILLFLANYGIITDNMMNVFLILRWPVAFLMLFALATMNYYVLPARDYSIARKSVIPGSLFFCIFWLLGSWGFSLYVNELGTYNKVYGTLGAFAILMLWLYYSSIIMLVGAAINNQTLDKFSKSNVPELEHNF